MEEQKREEIKEGTEETMVIWGDELRQLIAGMEATYDIFVDGDTEDESKALSLLQLTIQRTKDLLRYYMADPEIPPSVFQLQQPVFLRHEER